VLVCRLEVWCSAAFSSRKVVCWFLGPVALQCYVGLAILGSESETCVGSRVHLVRVSISFKKIFYRLPFTPALSGSPYWSFTTLVRPARRTLERGRQNPRKGCRCLTHARTSRRRDVGPVRRVSSIAIFPVRPSSPLRRHPEHYSAIPGTMGAQDDRTSPRPPLRDLQSSVSPILEMTHAR
jgi:hypothetical protein